MIRISRFLALPFLLSLTGLAFCCWNLWGTPEVLCVTEGCRLFQNFSVMGISLWAAGAAAFVVLMLGSLPGLGFAGYLASALGLLLDCVLLCVMIVAAPCFNCLIIGLLLAMTFLAFRSSWQEEQRRGQYAEKKGFSPLFLFWLLLFLLDAGVVAHGLMKPWPLPFGNAASATRIYFSPSCEACRSLVSASSEDARNIAWYPVAENDGDMAAIGEILRRTQAGESLADVLESMSQGVADTNPASSFLERGILQLRLWRNRAHVLEAGSERLPFVEFSGAPSVLLRPSAPDKSGDEGLRSPAEESLFGVSGFCSGEEPCETPALPGRGSLHELMNSNAASGADPSL